MYVLVHLLSTGGTTKKVVRRMEFYDPRTPQIKVEEMVEELKLNDEHVDYLTFAPMVNQHWTLILVRKSYS